MKVDYEALILAQKYSQLSNPKVKILNEIAPNMDEQESDVDNNEIDDYSDGVGDEVTGSRMRSAEFNQTSNGDLLAQLQQARNALEVYKIIKTAKDSRNTAQLHDAIRQYIRDKRGEKLFKQATDIAKDRKRYRQ